jgi:hypothetical protein
VYFLLLYVKSYSAILIFLVLDLPLTGYKTRILWQQRLLNSLPEADIAASNDSDQDIISISHTAVAETFPENQNEDQASRRGWGPWVLGQFCH